MEEMGHLTNRAQTPNAWLFFHATNTTPISLDLSLSFSLFASFPSFHPTNRQRKQTMSRGLAKQQAKEKAAKKNAKKAVSKHDHKAARAQQLKLVCSVCKVC